MPDDLKKTLSIQLLTENEELDDASNVATFPSMAQGIGFCLTSVGALTGPSIF